MTNKKVKEWKEISREEIFKKFSRKIDKVIFEQPNGEKYDLYLKIEGPAVAILPLTEKGEVILVKQFRPGPKKILCELPGGLGNMENLKESAERELLEETGYKGDLILVTKSFDCAYSTMNRFCFVATNCKKVEEISNLVHDDDEDKNKGFMEEKEIILLSLDEFRSLLRSGEMTDIEVGYLGLDYLNLL